MVLYNLNEDAMIAEKNKDEKTSIASMTKIMTVLVALQQIDDMKQTVTLTPNVFEGLKEANASVAGFEIGQVVTYEDLLYGSFLPSGADATNALAINLTGNIDNFVALMNEEAKKLGMLNTHFANTNGLDDKNHYSTVNDVAVLLKKALENEEFKKIFSTKKYLTSDHTLTFYSTLNRTLDTYNIDADYIVGGKTGYTLDAGRCLASLAYDEVNDISYLLVTAKAPTTTSYYHVLDAKNIYEYYFENYKYFDLVKENQEITKVKTKYAKEKEIIIEPSSTIKKYLKSDFDVNNLEIKYVGEEVITYNTKLGSKLGTVYINYQGKVMDNFDVFLNQALHFSLFAFIKDNIIIITLMILFGILWMRSITNKKKRYKRKNKTRF